MAESGFSWKVQRLTSKGIVKEVVGVMGGQVGKTGLGFIATIITARLLSVEAFGLFSLFIAAISIGVELTGKSLDWGMVTFSSKYYDKSRQKANMIFKVILKIRLIVSAVFLVLAFWFVRPIAENIFHRSDYVTPLTYACIGTIGMSMWWYVLAIIQVRQMFTLYGLLNLLNGLMKVGAVGLLFFVHMTSLENILTAYVVVFFLSFAISFATVPKDFLKTEQKDAHIVSTVLHFSKWIIITNILSIFYVQQGFFLLGYFRDAFSLGIYSSAWNLVYGLDVLVFSLITVFLPKVSKLKGTKEHSFYIKQTLKLSIALIVLLLPLYFFAESIMTGLYSKDFSASTVIFQILFWGAIISLPMQPISLLLLTINRPQVFAYVSIVILLVTLTGNILVIPEYGEVGAAYVSAITKVLYGLLIMVVYYILLKKSNSKACVAGA